MRILYIELCCEDVLIDYQLIDLSAKILSSKFSIPLTLSFVYHSPMIFYCCQDSMDCYVLGKVNLNVYTHEKLFSLVFLL
jgi:hypothetical protein